jgi:hypothetical protein
VSALSHSHLIDGEDETAAAEEVDGRVIRQSPSTS